MSRNVLLLPGDGIGPEIVAEAEKVLYKVNEQFGLGLSFDSALVGGAAIDANDTPLPDETLEKARKADAILPVPARRSYDHSNITSPNFDNIVTAAAPKFMQIATKFTFCPRAIE